MANTREIVYDAAKVQGLTAQQVRDSSQAQITTLATGTTQEYRWRAVRTSVANRIRIEELIVQENADATQLQTKLREIARFSDVLVISVRPVAVEPPDTEVPIEIQEGDWIIRFP